MRETKLNPLPMSRLEEAVRQMIHGRGFAALRVPLEIVDLNRRVRALWREFVARPQAEKEKFTLKMLWTPDEEGPDDGWVPKNGQPTVTGGAYDRKEFFHWRPFLAKELRRRGIPLDARMEEWFRLSAALTRRCRALTLQIYKAMDAVLPGYGFAKRHFGDKELDADSVLRMLFYDLPRHIGQELGKLHIDRNFITLHLAESHPGCIIHDGDSETLLRCEDGVIVIFAGRKAQLLTGGVETDILGNSKFVVRGGIIQPALHRIAVPEGADLTVTRDSLIYFAHCRMDSFLSA